MPRHTDNTWLERIAGYLKIGSGGSSAVTTSVNDTNSNVVLLPAKSTRAEAIIYNDSSALLYIKLGQNASTTDFTVQLGAGETFITQYSGQIDGIWSADSTGAARVTEIV